MKVQRAIEITAPPEKIWPFLVNPVKILEWCLTFKKFEYTTENRSGVNVGFYIEEKAAGPLLKLNFTTTEWVENHKIAFKMTSGNFLKGYEQKWAIEANPPGSRFIFMEQIDMPYGFIGKIMETFAKGSSESTIEKMLSKLKQLTEV